MAFCSSSDFRAKLILETMSTARSVPSFITTTSSLTSLKSRNFLVDGPALDPASFFDCMSFSVGMSGLVRVVDSSGVDHQSQFGQFGSRNPLLDQSLGWWGRRRGSHDLLQFRVSKCLVPDAQTRLAEGLYQVEQKIMERLAVNFQKGQHPAEHDHHHCQKDKKREVRQLKNDEQQSGHHQHDQE